MAKKKAPAAPSKKNNQKQKAKTVEDKTFGLKNKNKSKKVQQHIEGIKRNVYNSGDPKQRKLDEQRAAKKAEMKARKRAAKEEQEALFGAALMAVSKKHTTSQSAGKQEAVGRDGNDESNKKSGTSRAMKMMFQMDAQEMDEKLREDPNYVPTLEDEIERERQLKVQELKRTGKGTPVTPESFAAWQERKRQRKLEADKKVVQQELRKKKGGKGLGVLSGRALYEYKKDLFKDKEDDAAMVVVPEGDDDEEEEEVAAAEVTNGIAKLSSELFLEGDDDDLDDLDED